MNHRLPTVHWERRRIEWQDVVTVLILVVLVGSLAVISATLVQRASTRDQLSCEVRGLRLQLEQEIGERVGPYPVRERC